MTRKPTKLLKLSGNFRADRHGKRVGEVEPEPGLPNAPEWLIPEARAEWDRIVADSKYTAALCKIDRAMIAVFCQMWGRWVEAEQAGKPVKTAHVAVMVNLGAKLGLKPSDRSKVKTPEPPKPANRWELLKGNNGA